MTVDQSKKNLKSAQYLILDDCIQAIEVLKQLLLDLDIRADQIEVASSLLDVTENDFEFVFCGLDLPIDTLIDTIKQLEQLIPNAGLIVCSHYQNLEYVQQLFKVGAQDYLIKSNLNSFNLHKALLIAQEHNYSKIKRLSKPNSSERRLKEIVNALPGAVISYQLFPDGTERILFLSEGAENIWGISRYDVVNNLENVWDKIVEQDRDEMKKSIKKSAEELSIWNQKFSIKKEGKVSWLNAIGTPNPQPDGSVVYNTVIIDITDQVTTERKLKEINQRFELAAKATKDIIWDWDFKTGEIKTNHQFNKDHLKKQVNQKIHVSDWVKTIYPHDLERVKEKFEGKIYQLKDNYWSDEFRVLKPDGNVAYVFDQGYVVYDQQHNPVRMVGALQDLTEQRRLLYDLKERNKELVCFYNIMKLINDSNYTTEKILEEVTEYIKEAYQNPSITHCKITVDEKTYLSANFKSGKFKQTTNIFIGNQSIGEIEIYLVSADIKKEAINFLIEEQKLLITIGTMLSNMLSKKSAEERLVVSETNLKTIFNNTSDAYLLVDCEGNILSLNKEAQKLNKEAGHDQNIKKITDRLPEEYQKDFHEKFQKALNGKRVIYERKLITTNGVAWFEISIIPIKAANENIKGICIIIKNITELKKAEQETKRVAANMESLLNSTEDAYVLVDKNCNIQSFNQQANENALKIISKKLKVGEYFPSFMPAPQEAIKSAIKKALQGKKIDYMQTFLCNNEDVAHHVVATPIKGPQNEIDEVSIVIRDITARKIYEKSLLYQQQLLSNSQQLAKLGSFSWNVHDNSISATQQFYEIFNILPGSELKVYDFYKIIHDEDKSLVKATFKKSINNHKPFLLQFRTKEINGQNKVIRGKGMISSNKHKNIVTLLCVLQDITKQKSAEQAMQFGQELERKRLAKDLHDDIGQLLTATKFKLESIPENADDYINNQIQDVKKYIGTTITEVRNITRNLSTKVLDYHGLEKAISELCKSLASDGKIKVKFNYKVNTQLDSKLKIAIYRIMQEGVNNILKHANASVININILEKKQHLLVQIKDNGKGFDLDHDQYILNNGLNNMKERTSLFIGHFELESKINKGTTITCKFPLIKEGNEKNKIINS